MALPKPLSASNRFSSVPEGDLQALRNNWIELFNRVGNPPGGSAELWLHAVLDYLVQKKVYLVEDTVIRQEQRLIELGLAQELFAQLNEIVPEQKGATDEAARFYELLHATNEDRLAALKKVLHGRGE